MLNCRGRDYVRTWDVCACGKCEKYVGKREREREGERESVTFDFHTRKKLLKWERRVGRRGERQRFERNVARRKQINVWEKCKILSNKKISFFARSYVSTKLWIEKISTQKVRCLFY